MQIKTSLGHARISEPTLDLAVFGNEALTFNRRGVTLPASRSGERAHARKVGHAWLTALAAICRRPALAIVLAVRVVVNAIRTITARTVLADDHLLPTFLRGGLEGHAFALVHVVFPAWHFRLSTSETWLVVGFLRRLAFWWLFLYDDYT